MRTISAKIGNGTQINCFGVKTNFRPKKVFFEISHFFSFPTKKFFINKTFGLLLRQILAGFERLMKEKMCGNKLEWLTTKNN